MGLNYYQKSYHRLTMSNTKQSDACVFCWIKGWRSGKIETGRQEEIGRADDNKKRSLLNIIAEYSPTRLVIDEEVAELAQKYISEGVFPVSKIEDAIHAAVATVFEVDALISWNLKHLANLKKMELINAINMKAGYFKRLELITPMEVSDEEV